MKQSDLKHWKYSKTDELEAYETERGVLLRPCAGDVFFDNQCHLNSAELTESARIAEHYEKTKQFAPDAEEPTVRQVELWLARDGWIRRHGRSWLKSCTMLAVEVAVGSDNIHLTVDAIALITQRKREDIVREMVAL